MSKNIVHAAPAAPAQGGSVVGHESASSLVQGSSVVQGSSSAQSGGSRRLRKRSGHAHRRKTGSTKAGGCWFGMKKTRKHKSRKHKSRKHKHRKHKSRKSRK